MTKINNEKFFTKYRDIFGSLTQSQVDGLNFLLDEFNKSEIFDTKAKIAYTLATIYHETARTFQPIKEIGKGRNKKYGQIYYGRGYVQLTWISNYQKFAELLGIDLINNPDLALLKEYAFKIMELGMSKGYFTGKKLTDYFNGEDYYFGVKKENGKKTSPRQMINGFDCAELIGDYADKFFSIIEFE